MQGGGSCIHVAGRHQVMQQGSNSLHSLVCTQDVLPAQGEVHLQLTHAQPRSSVDSIAARVQPDTPTRSMKQGFGRKLNRLINSIWCASLWASVHVQAARETCKFSAVQEHSCKLVRIQLPATAGLVPMKLCPMNRHNEHSQDG